MHRRLSSWKQLLTERRTLSGGLYGFQPTPPSCKHALVRRSSSSSEGGPVLGPTSRCRPRHRHTFSVVRPVSAGSGYFTGSASLRTRISHASFPYVPSSSLTSGLSSPIIPACISPNPFSTLQYLLSTWYNSTKRGTIDLNYLQPEISTDRDAICKYNDKYLRSI